MRPSCLPQEHDARSGDDRTGGAQADPPCTPAMNDADANAGCMKSTGGDDESYAVQQSIGTRWEFGAMGVSVKDRKETDSQRRDPQVWPRFPKHGNPEREGG